MLRKACLLSIAFALSSLCGLQAASAATKFGIYYAVWHCPVAKGNPEGRPIYDISKILLGQGSWGPVPEFHWWSKPAAGYYCLATNDALLRQHAQMLRDAGIDFVYVDSTNWPYADNRDKLDSAASVIAPFNELLKVWNTVPGAPKVVPWAPLTSNATMLQYLLSRLNAYPKLRFDYQGKPLALVVDNDTFPVDQAKFAQLSANYTLRKMWAFFSPNPTDIWTFMQPCAAGFKNSKGTQPCDQNYAVHNGSSEEIPIIGAYQETHISDKATATPRFHGRTFVKQFETLSNHPDTPIALIYGWNEWIAQRFCFTPSGDTVGNSRQCSTDRFSDGSKIFVDEYAEEYSKDIEPAAGSPGSYYYQLMKTCISLYRRGAKCGD